MWSYSSSDGEREQSCRVVFLCVINARDTASLSSDPDVPRLKINNLLPDFTCGSAWPLLLGKYAEERRLETPLSFKNLWYSV